ncbi:Ribonuclease D [Marinobacter nitratireducens]|uniref:Ribonuclease D n=1 Tax=Marinobacter nitratireducens TaxID=1137280 RepID=A0A072NGL2_9GAMM|nr:HRDC domain-containing protein [Marinobacter nitratireducens]KEF32255.1 Ribonuclease D [Marinobacter nitratireducens]
MAPSIPAVDVPPVPEIILWIDTPEDLDRWLADAAGKLLSLDTEFERVNTFYPIPGLVQLGLAGEFRLVDPSVAEASERFRELLGDPDTTKLLYAMSEDLELFRHWLDIDLKGVLDLQIGAALAGEGFSLGYARIVEALFGVVLDKSATRSDWLARPLSDAQQHYAVEDIRFLEPMYARILSSLREKALEGAFVEESARFANELAHQESPAEHYLKLRGGWTLTPQQQSVLKELVQWREHECARRDKPRNRILADALLIAIADRLPESLAQLRNIQGVPSGVVRHHGQALLDLVETGCHADNSGMTLISPPLTRDQQGQFKSLKKIIRKMSEHFDIPMEILAPRKRLEKAIQQRSLANQEFFTGWRANILAPVHAEIEELLKS